MRVSQELGEPEWMLEWRKKHLAGSIALPKELKYGIGINAVLPLSGDLSSDRANRGADYHVDASKGVEIYTWREAINQEELAPIIQRLMESEFFPVPTNYFSGIGQALFSSGIVVYAQPHVDTNGQLMVEKLVLDTKLPNARASDIVIVIAKEGARLDMTSMITCTEREATFFRTFVVLSERDTDVSIAQRADVPDTVFLAITSRGIAAAHAKLLWSELFSGAGRMKSETDNLLVGESAHAHISHAVVAGCSSERDIFASVKHVAAQTSSIIRTAGVGIGPSKTVYRGLIDMEKGVSGVSGIQEARFLVLDPSARIDAIPSLDISSKDVRCGHKLAITHIDPLDVFYLKSRGLSDSESKRMFLEGHFAGLFEDEASRQLSEDLMEQLTTITI